MSTCAYLMSVRRAGYAAILIAAAAFTGPAGAQSVEQFYKDKRITMLVGNPPGSGYDAYARLITRHLGNHLPGNPSFIVQNMPGAAGLQVTNHLYNVAARDGTVMASIQRGLLLSPLLETRQVDLKYDVKKFNWIGSTNVDTGLIFVWHTAPHKSFQDLLNQELVIGVSGVQTEFIPLFLNNVLGTKLKLITGYQSATDVLYAMEKGEVQGRVSGGWVGDRPIVEPWAKQDKVRFLAVLSPRPSAMFPNVPLLRDLTKDETQKQIVDLMLASQLWGRPFALPPAVPQDRVAAVRQAFNATMKDEAFLAEAGRMKLDIDVVGGEEMHEILERLYATPKDVVEAARKSIQPSP